MFLLWTKTNINDFLRRQQQWNVNKHDAKYIKKNFNRFINLQTNRVINKFKIFKMCVNFFYFVQFVFIVENEIQRWINDEIQKNCQFITTKRIKTKCILNVHYANFVKNYFKFDDITRILNNFKHREIVALIMSNFFEFLLIAKRINCYFLSIVVVMSIQIHVVLRSHNFENFVIMFVFIDSFHIIFAFDCFASNAHISWHFI